MNNNLITIDLPKTILNTNIMLVQSKRFRSTYTIFYQKPLENIPIAKENILKCTENVSKTKNYSSYDEILEKTNLIKNEEDILKCTENVSKTKNCSSYDEILEKTNLIKNEEDILKCTENVSKTKNCSSYDEILQETNWIRSEEGITETLEGKNNNNTKTLEQYNYNNTETDNNNTSQEDNYTYAESDGNNTTQEGNSTNGKSHDNLKDCLDLNNDAYSRSDSLNLENIKGNTSEDLDIASKIIAKIDKLISKLQDGNEPFDNMFDILINVDILWFILLILFMLVVGILSIIKNLCVQAKINYISKLQNTINFIKLEKVLSNLNYKTIILKTKSIANNISDIINKLIKLKGFYDDIKYIVKKFENYYNNRDKLVNLRSNNIGSFDTNIIVYMSNLPNNPIINNPNSKPIINQNYNYYNSPIWPPLNRDHLEKYEFVKHIWKYLKLLRDKYNGTHKYYHALTRFLGKNCNKRTKKQKNEKTYLCKNTTIDKNKHKFNKYAKKKNIRLDKIVNKPGTIKVTLISIAREFLVNESEVMVVMSQFWIHYFNDTMNQRNIWLISQQPREINTNREPDFYIQMDHDDVLYTKVIVEVKTFDGDSFKKMINQIEISSRFTIGKKGEYVDEFDEITRQIKCSGSSQFVILIRGTQIAFLERYSYTLESVDAKGSVCMVPLTMPVDKTNGIENPRLASIMNNYRHLCIKNKNLEFPYDVFEDDDEDNNDDFPGKYYVFDLLKHPDACHELFMYVSSELPRLHGMSYANDSEPEKQSNSYSEMDNLMDSEREKQSHSDSEMDSLMDFESDNEIDSETDSERECDMGSVEDYQEDY